MFSGHTDVGLSATRMFNASATASSNASICKYGNTTEHGCSTVTRSAIHDNVTVSSEDGWDLPLGPLQRLTGHIATGGDSGRLWFYRNAGYSIHSGVVDGGSVLSSLPHALSRFGLKLWQG